MFDEDHADAAGFLHRKALVDASRDAAIADHDLARDLRRIEYDRTVGGAVAEGELAGIGAGQTGCTRIDQRRRATWRSQRRRRCT